MIDVLPSKTSSGPELDDKYRSAAGSFFFTGVQALVRVPLDQMRADRLAGLRTATFISGYQGSPLGGFDREIIGHQTLMDEHHVVHRSGLNEELGATAVMGSQVATTFPEQKYDGVLGIWYGKAPVSTGPATPSATPSTPARTPTAGSWPSPATTPPTSPRPCRRPRSSPWPTSTCPSSTPAMSKRSSTSAATASTSRGRPACGPRSRS